MEEQDKQELADRVIAAHSPLFAVAIRQAVLSIQDVYEHAAPIAEDLQEVVGMSRDVAREKAFQAIRQALMQNVLSMENSLREKSQR